MNTHKKSRGKIYASIIGIFAAAMISLGVIGTFVSYPTSNHRETSSQAYQIVEKNGGAFNFQAYDTPEYNEIVNSPEAKYSSDAQFYVTIAQMAITIYIVGRIYKYIRKNNISPSKRAVGLTALLTAAGNVIAYIAIQYPTSFFTGIPVMYDLLFLAGLVGVGIVTLIIDFIIASLFEIVYNKRHSFIVE